MLVRMALLIGTGKAELTESQFCSNTQVRPHKPLVATMCMADSLDRICQRMKSGAHALLRGFFGFSTYSRS